MADTHDAYNGLMVVRRVNTRFCHVTDERRTNDEDETRRRDERTNVRASERARRHGTRTKMVVVPVIHANEDRVLRV